MQTHRPPLEEYTVRFYTFSHRLRQKWTVFNFSIFNNNYVVREILCQNFVHVSMLSLSCSRWNDGLQIFCVDHFFRLNKN